MFREDVDPSDFDVIKYYKDDIEALDNCQLSKIGLVSDSIGTYILDVPIDDDKSLPLDIRLDNYLEQRQVKGRK